MRLLIAGVALVIGLVAGRLSKGESHPKVLVKQEIYGAKPQIWELHLDQCNSDGVRLNRDNVSELHAYCEN